jgi:hypothetical protein
VSERAQPDPPVPPVRPLVFAWGVFGVLAILAQALWRLSPLAWEAMTSGMTALQWFVFAVWVGFNAYAEGIRGFHRRFSPRVVARAAWLSAHPTTMRVVLAPIYCMSLFGASRRGLIVARILVLAIVAIVVAVRMLEQPWRGIVDAGVVIGLSIGAVSIVWFAIRAARGVPPPMPPDLPDDELPAVPPELSTPRDRG